MGYISKNRSATDTNRCFNLSPRLHPLFGGDVQ